MIVELGKLVLTGDVETTLIKGEIEHLKENIERIDNDIYLIEWVLVDE